MQFDAGLTGEAGALAAAHRELLGRLPATVQAFVLAELQKWPVLFAAEQRYQRALLDHLSRLSTPGLSEGVAGIVRIEEQAGLDTMRVRDPGRFQEEAQAVLRRRRLLTAWRGEIDGFFQRIDPVIDAALHPPDAPRRLVVQIYGSGIAVQPAKLWGRFEGVGLRVPLKLDGARGSEGFLRRLFGGQEDADRLPALFAAPAGASPADPLEAWIVESHEALHELCGPSVSSARHPAGAGADRRLAGLSYDRLRGYRDDLTRALYRKIQAGVESPQAFAAYARSLKIEPRPGALLDPSDILQAFVRDVFLTGNGTLFVNNTFVEWAAVQALRRAQPRLLVTRFGVRDRLKPFSSLLLFSQPRASDQIPLIEDPVGSFIDVEQLCYYVWLNAEKSPAYRNRTLYLFLSEDIDQMLAIRSDGPLAPASPPAPATLGDVCATMAAWLGLPLEGIRGRPVPQLSA